MAGGAPVPLPPRLLASSVRLMVLKPLAGGAYTTFATVIGFLVLYTLAHIRALTPTHTLTRAHIFLIKRDVFKRLAAAVAGKLEQNCPP